MNIILNKRQLTLFKFYIAIAILIFNPFSLAAQIATTVNISGTTSTNTISNNTATVVDAGLTLTSNGTITGFIVSITGSYTTGDVLDYTGTLPTGVTAVAFNTGTRSLVFNGTTSATNWQSLLRTVRLRTTSAVCNPEKRKVSFVAGNKYYNILNNHYYEYNATGRSWTAAKANASISSYFGREGYLATITDVSENGFMFVLVGQNSWIGCSDNFSQINAALGYTLFANQAASDGNFYWVTGPERGLKISGRNAWGTGGVLPVSGVYNNWAPNEPNDHPGHTSSSPGEEDYGHTYTTGLWNDFSNTQSIGSVIEYGDMPKDNSSSQVVFTRNIYINGAPSGSITGGDISVCSGTNSTTLTLTGLTGTVVRWESSLNNFFTAGTTINNTTNTLTVTNISATTYYRVVVAITGCSSLETSSTTITVNRSIPGNIVAENNTICAGANVEFVLFGNTGNVLRWQTSTSSTFASAVTDITNTTTSLSHTISTAGTYYYRAVVQNNGCGSAVNTPIYTIIATSGTAPVGGTINNTEHCGGTNSGTMTLSGSTGTVVRWQSSTDNGIIWTNITNTTTSLSYSGIASNISYRAQLTNGSCGTTYSSVGKVTVYGTTVCRWDGGTSNAWETASNWCGGIAGSGIDVVINSTASNHLILDQNRNIGNLNFNGANRIITIGAFTLTVSSFTGGNNLNYISTNGVGMIRSTIINGASTNFPVGSTTYNPLSITNNTGVSDALSVRVFDNVYDSGYSGVITAVVNVARTWDIQKANANSGSGLNFVFNWSTGLSSSLTTPTLYHFLSGDWVKQTGTTSSNSTSLTYTGYTGTFSPFAIGDALTPLPINLISFTAFNKACNENIIKWTSAEEVNFSHYNLEWSADGNTFSTVAKIKGKGEVNGLNNYSFNHNSKANINFYRLKSIDMNGTFAYSSIAMATNATCIGSTSITLIPNPTEGLVNIVYENEEPITVKVYQIDGKLLNTIELHEGNKSIDLSAYKSGVYSFVIISNGAIIKTERILKM